MMLRPFALPVLLGCLLFHTAVHAELYRGTIGKLEVVMQLSPHVNPAVADYTAEAYFYTKYRQPIELYRSSKCSATVCYSEETQKSGASLVLHSKGTQLLGTWSDGKKSLPVTLSPDTFTPSDPLNTLYAKTDPLFAAWAEGMRFKNVKTTQFMGKTLQWLQEPKSGMTHFVIQAGYPNAILQDINPRLRARALKELAARNGCFGMSANADYETDFEPAYMDNHLISVVERNSSYCGGAHPNTATEALNYSVSLQRELSLEDVLWVGKARAQSFDPAMRFQYDSPFYHYRNHTFAPWLMRSFTQLYPQEMGQNDECVPEQENLADVFWWFTPKGIYIGQNLPHVMAACSEPDFTYLPYSLVRRYPGAMQVTLPQKP